MDRLWSSNAFCERTTSGLVYRVKESEDFIDSEIRTHLNDGSFIEIQAAQAAVVNPFLIAVNTSGKLRRCDDMRCINAFMASPMFKMQTLKSMCRILLRLGMCY